MGLDFALPERIWCTAYKDKIKTMPTVVTHAFVPIVLAGSASGKRMPLRFWVLLVFCAVFPDLDVIGFGFGIGYGDFLGPRGFSHSLFFAFVLSLTVAVLAFRKNRLFSKEWWLIWMFLFIAGASHDVLDMFTDGGLGVALFSPFDTTRYLSPWRPLSASPIGIRGVFMLWAGQAVLASETMWIWLPLTVLLIITKTYRKIRKGKGARLKSGA